MTSEHRKPTDMASTTADSRRNDLIDALRALVLGRVTVHDGHTVLETVKDGVVEHAVDMLLRLQQPPHQSPIDALQALHGREVLDLRTQLAKLNHESVADKALINKITEVCTCCASDGSCDVCDGSGVIPVEETVRETLAEVATVLGYQMDMPDDRGVVDAARHIITRFQELPDRVRSMCEGRSEMEHQATQDFVLQQLAMAVEDDAHDPAAPTLVWESNGEAGDGQYVCSECGTELTEAHGLRDCVALWRAHHDRAFATIGPLQERLANLRDAARPFAVHADNSAAADHVQADQLPFQAITNGHVRRLQRALHDEPLAPATAAGGTPETGDPRAARAAQRGTQTE